MNDFNPKSTEYMPEMLAICPILAQESRSIEKIGKCTLIIEGALNEL